MAFPVRAHPWHSTCEWHTGQVCSVSTAALWRWASGCQQGVTSGFHSDLGGHLALGLPCTWTGLYIPQRAAPASPVRQGVSLGQEVFLRPLPAPSACSFHFLYASCGAACSWPVHGTVPVSPPASSPASRAGRSARLKPAAHGSGTAAHGSGRPARRAVRVGAGARVRCPRPPACSPLRTGEAGAAAVPVPVAMAALLMAHRLPLPLHHSCRYSRLAERVRAAPDAPPASPARGEQA